MKRRVEEYELGVVGIGLHFGGEEETNVSMFVQLWE